MADAGKTYNVLIVDDEQKICEIARVFLSLSKNINNVITANNAIEAMTKMQNQKFDLLIVDQAMPGKTGIELIEHLSQVIYHKNIKFILMSGCLTKEDVIMAVNSEIKDIIVKPFSRDDFMNKVAQVLGLNKI